ncbi:hypothetical protein L0Y65_04310 [Candidatus Micrarchaeota archaeon]|nr:hypothetical protein [Candidatus Micrarchaeota archaeon]
MITMALIDKLLLRGPEETARAQALREFRRIMPGSGRFSEVAESGLVAYYDRRFGRFEPARDRWNDAHQTVLRANPALRRIDVIADTVFRSGRFRLMGAGPVRSDAPPYELADMIAAIRMEDRPGAMTGMLTLDIGGEIKFSKLRIGLASGKDFLVRLSSLDGGMTVGRNQQAGGRLPETVHERAAEGSEVFQTISDTLAGIERFLRGISV